MIGSTIRRALECRRQQLHDVYNRRHSHRKIQLEGLADLSVGHGAIGGGVGYIYFDLKTGTRTRFLPPNIKELKQARGKGTIARVNADGLKALPISRREASRTGIGVRFDLSGAAMEQ